MKNLPLTLWREFLRPILVAVVLVVLFRSFLWEPFRIPSGSMEPNLLVGDFIFVSKTRYGYGPFSVPFLSLLVGHQHERLFGGAPRRGDMAVFRRPSNPKDILVKRIVGMPNDQLRVTGGVLEINGRKVTLKKLAPPDMYEERMPNKARHAILETQGDRALQDNTQLFRIPARHYFMMGDNRDNSLDSRFLDEVGFVPDSHLVGPVVRVWFSLDEGRFPFNIRWNRVLRPIAEIEAKTIRDDGR